MKRDDRLVVGGDAVLSRWYVEGDGRWDEGGTLGPVREAVRGPVIAGFRSPLTGQKQT